MDDFEQFVETQLSDGVPSQKYQITLEAIEAIKNLTVYIMELETRVGIDPDGIGLDKETEEMRNAALVGFSAIGEIVAMGVHSV